LKRKQKVVGNIGNNFKSFKPRFQMCNKVL